MFKADSPLLRCSDKYLNWGLLILRIAIAVIFIYMGYGKLFGGTPGIPGFTGMLSKIGVPAAGFFAYVVGIIEFFGGIAVLLGLWTRYITPFLAFIMLISFFTVKQALPDGNIDVALFAIAIALTFTGPGTLSLVGMHAHKKQDGSGHVEMKQEEPPTVQ